MFSNKATTRSTQEIVSDFGELVEEGTALLGELMQKPQESAINLRAVLDDVSEKVAGFQSSATKAAQEGAEQGAKYARQANRYLHDNPWPTVAAGVILGVLATLWWSQRR